MRTEEELARAMREAAEQAPERDLLTELPARRRSRTRKRAQAALAAVAVVTVIGGTAAAGGVFSRGGGEAASPVESPEPAETFTNEAPGGASIEEVWPQAIFTMPAVNADGWRYRPINAISATEVLTNAESSFEKAGALEVYNFETRTARVITKIPTTPGLKEYFPQETAFDASNVAWFVNAERPDGTAVREFWTAPFAGGEAKLVATFKGKHTTVESIALDGETIVWSEGTGGVWRLPLSGGTPEKMQDSDDLHLIQWPWAGDTPLDMKTNQSKVVNLQTWEVRKIQTADGVTGLRCGPTWCYGQRGERGLVQRVDGGGVSEPKGFDFMAGGLFSHPILDRFLQTYESGVYDIATGAWVTYRTSGDWTGVGTSSAPSAIIYWGTTKGRNPKEYRVVNLAAVPPAQ